MLKRTFLMAIAAVLLCGSTVFAAFNSGSSGADGAFDPEVNTEVILPIDGVLNYTTVNIREGVTVTFKKNTKNTPIFIRATGDVTIAGIIDIAGSQEAFPGNGKGGPGGYDGGFAGYYGGSGSKGLGPGGGGPGVGGKGHGGGGGFGTEGVTVGAYSTDGAGGPIYGNTKLLPFIGGSGGGGASSTTSKLGGPGGGGGGAIAIASSTIITVTGSIIANGGGGGACSYYSCGGGGSGGAIKLVANEIAGNGALLAGQGLGGGNGSYGANGGLGRVRLEAYTDNFSGSSNPSYFLGEPTSLFASNPASLSIDTVDGNAVPASPTGSYTSPDIILPNTTVNPIAVDLSASNIPVGTTVTVWAIPQHGDAVSVDTILNGTEQSSTASASISISTEFPSILSAEATFNSTQAMYFDGEKIEKIKIASRVGGAMKTVYITSSGKEVPGDLFAVAADLN